MGFLKLILVGIVGIFLSILFFIVPTYILPSNSGECDSATIFTITYDDVSLYNETEIQEKLTRNLKAEIMQDVWTWSDFVSMTIFKEIRSNNQTIQILFPDEFPENSVEFSVIKNTLLDIEYLSVVSESVIRECP